MNHCLLLITRAAIMAVAAVYLWRAGRNRHLRRQGGWFLIAGGFTLLLFGLLLEISAYFSAPEGSLRSVPSRLEFLLRDIFGYFLGMILLATGFFRWIPAVLALSRTREDLEKSGAELEKAVAERTRRLEGFNIRLEEELAERKNIEKELEKFKTICDRAPYGVGVIDMDMKLIYVNQALAEMHGFPPGEPIGKDVSVLHSRSQLLQVRELIDGLRREGIFPAVEVWHVRSDGSVFPTLMTGAVIRDNAGAPLFLAATMLDITSRKQREEELVRLSSALAGLADMVLITDLDHRIIYANAAAETILGYTPSEMIGREAGEYFEGLPGNPRRLAEKIGEESTGGAWEGELRNRRKDGEMIDIHLTMTVLRDESGLPAGFVGISRDITERKQAAAILEQLYRDLRGARSQLVQAEKLSSLGLLAAGLAHELNSPLDGLMTMLRLTRKEAGPESADDERTAAMLAAAEHMARIVGDLTAFARQSEGVLEKLDLNEVIEHTLSFSTCQIVGRGITVVRELGRPLVLVRGDRGQLQQVVLNLLINARDAMPQGGRLVIKTENSPDLKSVVMTVGDNGAGIEPEYLNRIFDPFFTTKKQGEGIGLGLSVAYGIIDNHRGRITVASQPGKGTIFTVRLPAAFGAPDEKSEDPAGR